MIQRNITYNEKSLIVPLYQAIVIPHLEYYDKYYTGLEAILQEGQRWCLNKYRGEGGN